MTPFGMKVFINNHLTLHWDCFGIKRVKCIPGNKTSTNKPPLMEFYAKKRENGIFSIFQILTDIY